MPNKKNAHVSMSDRALEMVMRDVLDALSEISLESGFKPSDGGFEIIDIYPANRKNTRIHEDNHAETADSDILQFPDLRRAAG